MIRWMARSPARAQLRRGLVLLVERPHQRGCVDLGSREGGHGPSLPDHPAADAKNAANSEQRQRLEDAMYDLQVASRILTTVMLYNPMKGMAPGS